MKTNAKLGLGMYPYLRFSESLDATGQRWTSFSGVGSREVLFDITRKVAPQRLEQLREWHVGTHKTVRGSASAYVDCAEGDEVLPLLAPAHHALIAALSKRSEQASVRLQGAHAEGML